ncbi:kelch repeat and BTB domain-containing protein 11 [Sceloporus undulatus]|uniref:kelch repeat and BTB domain-containing protein 11 n=1 Tax=Sceloporus undulatus TaxID=8520 RepID=UPI001C4CB69B|nr:kelch repeat and BTB domain-containing protein 11 [Sceloporus undulatus]XP_042302768.1 kelch repeat and BTB domain-containing protein 11 [Sceloporus undulatus]XP_042302769.1 kelch repeat and BTB domain-containing protein 11 [Sceloporus undulatus]XP_042302770.1 kelch repeat and BTB domain-containing protein 11 [Sceloporus undulatus]XP_042302771.1 kelch repeat and BTB domain-containing protein 11 [Sceloporus undulatus]
MPSITRTSGEQGSPPRAHNGETEVSRAPLEEGTAAKPCDMEEKKENNKEEKENEEKERKGDMKKEKGKEEKEKEEKEKEENGGEPSTPSPPPSAPCSLCFQAGSPLEPEAEAASSPPSFSSSFSRSSSIVVQSQWEMHNNNSTTNSGSEEEEEEERRRKRQVDRTDARGGQEPSFSSSSPSSSPSQEFLPWVSPSSPPPDLVLEVCGRRLRVHKAALAAESDYFRARASREVLRVSGVSFGAVRALLEFAYTGRMVSSLGPENLGEVASGARALQMPSALRCAAEEMQGQLRLDTCLPLLALAKRHRLAPLREAAYRFMSHHYLQVLRQPSVYGRLSGAERELILRRRWEAGRPCLLAAEVSDAFERAALAGSRPPSRESSRPQSPSSVMSLEESGALLHCYQEEAQEWRVLTQLPEEARAKGCAMCVLYNYLFLAGGIATTTTATTPGPPKLSDKVFCYNPLTDTWSQVKPMGQPRSQLKLLALDGCLYAIGGECLFTVEKYDPRADRWSPVAPLPKGAFAVAHEATTCNGEIYVSGGSLFYRLLKYDPKRDEWQECPYNASRRRSADMVAYKSCIYRFDVSSGRGEAGQAGAVEVFRYNTVAKHWGQCASWRPSGSPLQPFRCAALANTIYCVNRTGVLRFHLAQDGQLEADGSLKGTFDPELLKAPLDAKGLLLPFVLTLPEKEKMAEPESPLTL